MINKQINKNSIFLYSEDLELILIANQILTNKINNPLITNLYNSYKTTIDIESLTNKYFFLYEIIQSIKAQHQFSFLEYLLYLDLESFNIDNYHSYLLKLKPEVFIQNFFCLYDTDINEIILAINDINETEKFYNKYSNLFSSFISMQTFFKQTNKIINDYINLLKELKTKDFIKEINNNEDKIIKKLTIIEKEIKENSLDYSQKIMGKTFKNRGPYKTFYFIPSLITNKPFRLFKEIQILFFPLEIEELADEQILDSLKIIADTTRFKIISLLNNKDSLRGMDIAKELSIATSTVSHHMEQLKKSGIINEEQVKNSKYYSLNTNQINQILKRLSEVLSK